MKTQNINNQAQAIEATNNFVNSLTKEIAAKYLDFNNPVVSLAQASIEIGVFGWYFNDRSMCTDIINVAILNKLATKA